MGALIIVTCILSATFLIVESVIDKLFNDEFEKIRDDEKDN